MKFKYWLLIVVATVIGVVWLRGKSELDQLGYMQTGIFMIGLLAYLDLRDKASDLKGRVEMIELLGKQNR